MPEDKCCKMLHPLSRTCEQKKKKKKKVKKSSGSNTAADNTEKPRPASLPPAAVLPPQSQPEGQLPGTSSPSKNNQSNGCGRRSKSHSKDSPGMQTTKVRKPGQARDLAQGNVEGLCVQVRESLRWEGALQDPQEEAKRLEQYRANRRMRYIAHREALLKETLKQTKDHQEKKGLNGI